MTINSLRSHWSNEFDDEKYEVAERVTEVLLSIYHESNGRKEKC